MSNEQREAENPLGFAPRAEASGSMTVEVAHEFSNMLTIVLGSLEQMRRQPLDDQGRQQLARAEWGARRACALLSRCSPLSDPCPR